MSHQIRVLHALGRLQRGGVETWLLHMLRNIDRSRFAFDFLVSSPDPAAYDAEVLHLGSRIICCPSPRSITYAARLRSAMLAHGPYDIVHSHSHHFSGLVLAVAASAGVKTRIAHSHATLPNRPPTLTRRAYLGVSEKLIDRFATHGLAASSMAATDLFGQAWKRDPRWRLLLYGLDLSPFSEQQDAVAVRDELGIPSDAFVVGHVGRLAPQKNHEFMVQIACELRKRDSRAQLVFVGEGSLRAKIESQVRARGLQQVVRFIAGRDDIPRVLRAFDAFLFPSHFEGLGLVGIEAQAAGLPVILSDSIPPEIEVVRELVHWRSLREPAASWADAILATRGGIRVDPTQALETVQSSPFNIVQSLNALQALYSAAAREWGRAGPSA